MVCMCRVELLEGGDNGLEMGFVTLQYHYCDIRKTLKAIWREACEKPDEGAWLLRGKNVITSYHVAYVTKSGEWLVP